MAQGTSAKKYHREYAGPMQVSLAGKINKKMNVVN